MLCLESSDFLDRLGIHITGQLPSGRVIGRIQRFDLRKINNIMILYDSVTSSSLVKERVIFFI
jgi:hypothetical protein